MQRKSLFSGKWYPVLKKEIETYIPAETQRKNAIAAICPHASWIYSGKVTGEVLSQVKPAQLYILVGPNHRGNGAPVAVYPEGTWETPLGDLTVEESVAAAIISNSGGIARADTLAHGEEHSLEVQLPFIKQLNPDAKIVPISLFDYRPETCSNLGLAIAKAVKKSRYSSSFLLLASSDMSHYVTAEHAHRVDALAIERILKLDPEGLLQTVKENKISMCGSGPVATVLHAAKALKASSGRLVRYATSGDVTGDRQEVVGYAGILIT